MKIASNPRAFEAYISKEHDGKLCNQDAEDYAEGKLLYYEYGNISRACAALGYGYKSNCEHIGTWVITTAFHFKKRGGIVFRFSFFERSMEKTLAASVDEISAPRRKFISQLILRAK